MKPILTALLLTSVAGMAVAENRQAGDVFVARDILLCDTFEQVDAVLSAYEASIAEGRAALHRLNNTQSETEVGGAACAVGSFMVAVGDVLGEYRIHLSSGPVDAQAVSVMWRYLTGEGIEGVAGFTARSPGLVQPAGEPL